MRSPAVAIKKSAPVFAALGDETRLRILAKLSSQGPLSISRITDGEAMTRQAITKHLGVLSEAGLVRDLRQGRERLWEVDPEPLQAARSVLDVVGQAWDQRLSRLKAFVEE
jgi:DNA-binding transcriptional ArsR family regulator